jgi:hypothetical protein
LYVINFVINRTNSCAPNRNGKHSTIFGCI